MTGHEKWQWWVQSNCKTLILIKVLINSKVFKNKSWSSWKIAKLYALKKYKENATEKIIHLCSNTWNIAYWIQNLHLFFMRVDGGKSTIPSTAQKHYFLCLAKSRVWQKKIRILISLYSWLWLYVPNLFWADICPHVGQTTADQKWKCKQPRAMIVLTVLQLEVVISKLVPFYLSKTSRIELINILRTSRVTCMIFLTKLAFLSLFWP